TEKSGAERILSSQTSFGMTWDWGRCQDGSSAVDPYMSKEWGGLGGEEVAEFAVEEGAVAGVHGDDLEGHAGVWMNAADNGAAANLSSGGIQQELHGTAKGYGALGANEEATEGEAVHVRDV